MAATSLSAAMAEIKANPGKFYVYVLSRPCGTPFYVGMGKDRRITLHEWEATTEMKSRKLSIIRKLIRSGDCINYRIDGWFDMRSDALARESELVLEFGRLDLGTGTLANRTNGGDDAYHLVGKRWNVQKSGALQSDIMREKWKDPEFRKRHAASMARARQNPAMMKNHSLAATAKWADPKFRTKIIAAQNAAFKSDEHRQKQASIGRSVWQRDGYKEKMLGSRSGKYNSEPGLTAMRAWWAQNPDKVEASIKIAQDAVVLSRLENPEMFRSIARRAGLASGKWARANPERASEIRKAAAMASGEAHKLRAEIRARCLVLMASLAIDIPAPKGRDGWRAWLKFEGSLLEVANK